MVETKHFPLASREVIAGETVQLTFNTAAGGFSFVAGQYISITAPGLSHLSPPQARHDFSIASSPNEVGSLSITFRTSGSPFKQKMLALPLETLVEIEGPKGVFTMPEGDTPLVFVAGGIGITPFRSMLRSLVQEKSTRTATLLYFNRNEASTAFLEEMRTMPERNPYCTTRLFFAPLTAESVEGVGDAATEWYVAGPPGMVYAARNVLRAKDIPDARIHTEEFTGYSV